MRKIAAFCTLLMTAAVLQAPAQEMKHEQDAPKSPRVTAKNDIAEISYGQPSKRGREIFGKLVPYGEVWRTGANMSTDITFNTDVLFGGVTVPKGTYSLFTIPEKEHWTVILNGQPAQKGASEYEANKSKNVATVRAKVEKLSSVQEALVIEPGKNALTFKWDNVSVSVPMKKK